MYATNIRASKYMKEKLTKMKRKIDKYVIIIGDFTTSLSVIDRTTRQKVSKDIKDQNNTINQFDQVSIKYSTQPVLNAILFKYTWNIHQDKLYAGP